MSLVQILRGETRPDRREMYALAAAALLLAGVLAQGARMIASAPVAAETKSIVRLDAGQIEKRELVFYPREAAADQSIRNFKPGFAWTTEPVRDVAPPSIAPVALAPLPPQIPKLKVAAAAPLPPVRPADLRHSPAARVETAQAAQPQTSGSPLARLVPSGADLMRHIGGIGESMRDSIGSVGTSLGKLIRVSSR